MARITVIILLTAVAGLTYWIVREYWPVIPEHYDQSPTYQQIPDGGSAYQASPLPRADHASSILYGEVIHRGDPTMKAVALTFDDGPHPEYTPRILRILQRYNVRATFFVVGMMAKEHPELVREEFQAGNEIGNHTYHHIDLSQASSQAITREWQTGNKIIASITGRAPSFCRPPSGSYNEQVVTLANESGLTMVLWSRYPHDYGSPPARVITARVLNGVTNGDIILLHDGVEDTITALPDIITGLQQRGFRIVLLEELVTN